MREIKFRVFDTKENKMIEHFLGARIDYALHYWETHKHVSEPMQYTGMHDKNGVEIYEGDIIHWHELNLEVKFIVDGWFAENLDESVTEAGQEWESSCSVIGNIHQHVHLLEQNKC